MLLQHQAFLLSPVTFTAGYCFCFGSIPSFFLELFLHWSPVAYWAPTDLGSHLPLSVSYHFAFSYCSWGSQGKNTKVVCHSFLQWTTFCQTSPPWPTHLGWPHMAWLSFTELDKAVVLVIRLTSFLWLWFQCVCPLMPSCNIYLLTWVFLTLDEGYLLTSYPSWPWTWSSSSQPSCACSATTPWTWGCSPRSPHLTSGMGKLLPATTPGLRRGVSPPGSCPWSRIWGSSSQPLLHHHSLALMAAAPDLERRVAPLGHHPWLRTCSSSSQPCFCEVRCSQCASSQQKSPKCSIWMQSQKRQNDLCSFPRQTIQYHSNPSLCPNQ